MIDIQRVEAGLDFDEIVREALNRSQVYRIRNGDVLEVEKLELSEDAC